MSAIVGVFGDAPSVTDAQIRAMLGRMSARGGDRLQIWRGGDAVLAVARHEWELDPTFSGPVLVVEDGAVVVAADASVY